MGEEVVEHFLLALVIWGHCGMSLLFKVWFWFDDWRYDLEWKILGVRWPFFHEKLRTHEQASWFEEVRSTTCYNQVQPLPATFGPSIDSISAQPKEAMSGYLEPSAGGSEMINLQVLCLNGEGCKLTLPPFYLGPGSAADGFGATSAKRGGRLALQYLASPLVLGQTLQEQGIAGQDVTLSCTYVPTDMCAAWRYASGHVRGVEEEFALEVWLRC